MKNIFFILIICITDVTFGQVAIGKNSISSPAVGLEFYDQADNARGLILPWVNSTAALSKPVNGTFVYDTSNKKVYVKYASGWKDLSVDNTGVVDTSLQDSLTELDNSSVIIGGDPSKDVTPGILILGDQHRLMILPKVDSPHLRIVNPSPGMIAYDTKTKELAVFNGSVWSFWKQ